MTALTTDSDSGADTPQGTNRDFRHLRQVSPRFYYAPDPNDGTGLSFTPLIARNHIERRVIFPRLLPTRTPALEPHAHRGPPFFNEVFHPFSPHAAVS